MCTMAIHVGLGYWHREFRKEVQQGVSYFMQNPQGRPHFAYADDFGSIELQLGGIGKILSLLQERRPFSKDFFGHDARVQRLSDFPRLFHDALHSGRRSHATLLAQQQSLDNVLERAYEKPFTGVHSTDGTRIGPYKIKNDLSDPNPSHHQAIINTHAQMMELAHIMDANAYVLHLTCWDDWLGADLHYRKYRINIAFDRFKVLMDKYRECSYEFPIAIENLEFSKFPATLEELWFAWNSCQHIAQEQGVDPSKIKMCLDFQHLRHSYKIINEPHNYQQYGRLRNIDSDDWGNFGDALLPGFYKAHRAVMGTSWHSSARNRNYRNGEDIVPGFLRFNIANILVAHVAGNDHISATQDPIYYRRRDHRAPSWQLDCRLMVHMLTDAGFAGAITIEDQSPQYSQHERSGLVIREYLCEREA